MKDDNNQQEVKLLTPEEFTALTRQVAESISDPGKVTSLLTQIQDGFAKLFASHNTVTEQNKVFTAENEKLRQYNMELFMNYGQKLVDESKPQATGRSKEQERAETITVNDLFKEEK